MEELCGVPLTPTLIITGDEDGIVPSDSAKSLAKAFPASIVNIMANVGHIPMVEVPEATADEYLAFRANLPQPQ